MCCVDVRAPSSRAKGEIPGFKGCFCNEFLSDDQTTFKTKEEIENRFKEDNIDLTKKLTFSCGAGITACINEVAARLVGAQETSIFDGSYQEYAKKGIPDFSNPEWETTYDF